MQKTILDQLEATTQTWLVTGAAGFIGSHLCEFLLKNGQKVRGADNFSTGFRSNIELLKKLGGDHFEFFEGNIADLRFCERVTEDIQFVLHQGALGSVPRSIEYPLATHWSNVDGTMNMLVAARDAGIKRFVFASSSAVYGDQAGQKKREDLLGTPQSPYAVTKLVNEIYAKNFYQTYGLQTIGLRYFNVFGPRQPPDGPYAAVIPKWISSLLNGEPVLINGDGSTSRDFCFVENVVQANILAALTSNEAAFGEAFNVTVGESITLNQLFQNIVEILSATHAQVQNVKPIYGPFRRGDIRHSLADISKARSILGFEPTHGVREGLVIAMKWYVQSLVQNVLTSDEKAAQAGPQVL